MIYELSQKIKEYAKFRTNDVARGAETPHLAALLVQKYGEGLIDACRVIYDNNREIVDPIYKLLDEEVEKIDPLWREHAKERWAGRPSDVVNLSEKNQNKI